MVNTRAAALKLLIRLEKDNAYSNIILGKELSSADYNAQDKRFVSALFYGVAERKITLDAVIDKYSKFKTGKLDCDVLQILRLGIYQLLYMDSVPESAAVNECVKLAKRCRNPSLSGFVNGVLRSFIRDGKKSPEGKTFEEKLSYEYSCPLWLVEKWTREYGEEAAASLVKTSVGKAPVTVRANTLRMPVKEIAEILESDGFSAENTVLENCLSISGSGAVEETKAYRLGLFHVQDISSQLCAEALGAKSGETVLDMCSAPGGKAFTIAEAMENKGSIFAFDLHESRVKLIKDGAERLGLSIIKAGKNDAAVHSDKIPLADRILCDVPCSGLGVIRRKPEIKYKNYDDFKELPELQLEILKNASKYLKAGGVIVYSTCTVSKAENERVVDRFLRENPNFQGVPVYDKFPQLSDYKATVIPEYFNSDGFFISKLKRIE